MRATPCGFFRLVRKFTQKGYGYAVRVAQLRTADGQVVCARCIIASSPWKRFVGLMGRSSLDPEEGMLFPGTGSIHMFFMRFPIDVVFLARDRTVVKVTHRLAPWRYAGARRAVAALELPAGRAAEVGVEPGDVLVFEELTDGENG